MSSTPTTSTEDNQSEEHPFRYEFADNLPEELDLSNIEFQANIVQLVFYIKAIKEETNQIFEETYISLIRKDRQSSEGWSVQLDARTLAVRSGKKYWTYGHLPSNQNDEFKVLTRFSLKEAYKLMRELDPNDFIYLREVPLLSE